MNVGLVARADDRGIGSMTWEFHKAMRPARTLVVREPGAEAQGFAAHVDRYEHAVVTRFDPKLGQLHEGDCREFLDGLDVVYLVETPYDVRFYEWARDARCATVLHVMPEFWRGAIHRPDVWWLPTSWRADVLPGECRIVEVPVPERPTPLGSDEHDGPVFVHVAGHHAVGDRNGTLLLFQAMRTIRRPCTLRIITQDARLPLVRVRQNITLQTVTSGVADRWSLYDDADALILPRRYGGLSLPALEAMASGLALVMSDVEPNRTWPIIPLPVTLGREIAMPCGPMKLADANPAALSRKIDDLIDRPAALSGMRAEALDFADAHSWRHLRSTYDMELHRAVIVASERRREGER